MRVEILKPFSVDGASGRTSFKPGEIVPSGQKNWVDKGLAREAPDTKTAKPEPKSAD